MTYLLKRYSKKVKQHLLHLPGWHSNRKIVVFESDDWGSIRMPSTKVYNLLVEKGIPINKLSYQKFDNLATVSDLEALFDVLLSFKDIMGKHPVITANTIVTNPDFNKIKESDFLEYHYELFTDTLQKYGNDYSGSLDLWKKGIDMGVFFPQFHGREHLNIKRWMHALRNNIGNLRFAFDMGVFDLSTNDVIHEESFMDCLDISAAADLITQEKYLIEGLDIFENIFGFRSSTFIAPCYVWHSSLEKVLFERGVIGIQGSWVQKVPIEGDEIKYYRKWHYTGQKNKNGQVYLVRNAAFEPSQDRSFDWISDILMRADIAFRMKKPLIISTHRLNFIGSLDPTNRDKNLQLLKVVLKKLLEKHPEIEFMHSSELVHNIIV